MMRAVLSLVALYVLIGGCAVVVINGDTQLYGPTGHPFCFFNCRNDSKPKPREVTP